MDRKERAAMRQAVADYMRTEGCGCCSDREQHDADRAVLAKMLRVPRYPDGSGHNFARFQTNKGVRR